MQSYLQKIFGEQGATLFLEGVELFNAGKHWDAHEVFEDLWRLHNSGDLKTLAQGFVQLAAAYSYIRKKRYASVLYLFEKCSEKFSATSHLFPQANIPELLSAVAAAKKEISRLGENGLDGFKTALYARIIVKSLPARPSKQKKNRGRWRA